MIRPPRLKKGSKVALVAPAGPVPREPFMLGAAILEARYHLEYDERLYTRTGFLAGDDASRLCELGRALADPTIEAVICARGGYGVMRLLPHLEPARFASAPKALVGFSDITALHAFATHAQVASLHAPVVTQLHRLGEEDRAALFALLESPAAPPPLTGLYALHGGVAEGRLCGGNLELVSRLWGTPFALDLDGAVLLLEEVGERPYRIDRQLTQLALGGAFAGLRAVIVGDLVGCAEKDGSGPNAEEVIAERFAGFGVPVVAGAPVGHGTRNRPLPLGARVRVDAGAGVVTFFEGLVA